MELTNDGIELVIEDKKFLRLMREGIFNLRETLKYLYCIQIIIEAFEYRRGIGLETIYHHGEKLGQIFITSDDIEALKRGEPVRFDYV